MQEVLARFDPIHGFVTTTLLVALAVFAAAAVFMYFNQKREVSYENRQLRNLGSMLAGLVAVAALGFGGFELFLQSRIKPVVLYTEGIELPKGEVHFKTVRKIYLHHAPGRSNLTGQRTTRGEEMLVVEQNDGKFHYLLAADYPVDAMIDPFQDQLKAYRDR